VSKLHELVCIYRLASAKPIIQEIGRWRWLEITAVP
jgi:hypothetical protein